MLRMVEKMSNRRVKTGTIRRGIFIDTPYFTMIRMAFPARIYSNGVYVYTQTIEVFYV
jgi:hypothetical protein